VLPPPVLPAYSSAPQALAPLLERSLQAPWLFHAWMPRVRAPASEPEFAKEERKQR